MRLMKSFLIMMILLMGVVTAFAQQELVLGDTLTVDASGTEMEFEFGAFAGDELIISATSDDFDTLITVLDDQGNVIDSDDDSAGIEEEVIRTGEFDDGSFDDVERESSG